MKPLLTIDVLTLFPEMFAGVFQASMISRAQTKGVVRINLHNLRDFSTDKHHKVDDKPFGGGPGMVLQVEPIYRALKKLKALPSKNKSAKPHVVYLSPQGVKFGHATAARLSSQKRIVLICGHYEGVDERAMNWIDEEISIGDYVLTGGEIPAMAVTDAVCRLVPGVVQEKESVENDSFYSRKLDCSHYTRPAEFMGLKVPGVLMSGNHGRINEWRMLDSVRNTITKRPDLLRESARVE